MRLGALLTLVFAGCQCGTQVPSCPASHNACGTSCLDLRTDSSSCGACGVVCPDGTACAGGQCYSTDCSAADCATNQICQTDACRNRFCVGVLCGPGLTCSDGNCVSASCGTVTCPAGSACVLGSCVDVECRGVLCPAGTECSHGACTTFSCSDATRNGGESDVDCGAVCATRCAEGQLCHTPFDCESVQCDAGVCGPAQCSSGQTQACGSSVGACRPGLRACVGGVFSACVGEVGPSLEVCDGLDNDCDGVVDPVCECPSGRWFDEPILASGNVGAYVAAALDRDGGLHLAFRHATAQRLFYAYHPGDRGLWRHEVVSNTTTAGREGRAAYDSRGVLHVVYEDTSGAGYLRYATRVRENVWTSAFIDSVGSPGSDNGLAVDSSDNLHVTTYDSTGQDLHYLFKPAGLPFAAPVVIASTGNVGEFSSIAVDTAGNLAVAFYDRTNLDLMLVEKRAGQPWNAPVTLDGAGTLNVGQYTALAFDEQGGLTIAYQDVTNLDLKLAERPAGQSAFTLVSLEPGTNSSGFWPSIAIDAQRGVHIVFGEHTLDDLRYAYRPAGGAFTFSSIDGASDNVGDYTSLRVDARGVHVAYKDLGADDLKFATRPTGATRFTVVPVDTVNNVGNWASLAIDPQGGVAIAHADTSSSVMRLALHAAGGALWQVEAADDAGTSAAGTEASIFVDPANGVHIAHYDGQLKYEYRAAGAAGFTHQTASSSNGRYPSLELSTAGEPFIAYYNATSNIALAWRDGGTWTSTTIDTLDTGHEGVSLQLLAGTRPCVMYRNSARDQLGLAIADGGGFDLQVVDSSGNPGFSLSSALGLDGLPRIIELVATSTTLRHARALPQGGWLFTPVLTGTDFSFLPGDVWPRLIIDARGTEHIVAERSMPGGTATELVYLSRAATSDTFTSTVIAPVTAGNTPPRRYYDLLAHPSGRIDIFFYDSATDDLRHRYRCP